MVEANVRKKPVVVQAQFVSRQREIETLEGTMIARVGDIEITGVNGERYPCKPEIFLQTYEPVTPADEALFHRVAEFIDASPYHSMPQGPFAPGSARWRTGG